MSDDNSTGMILIVLLAGACSSSISAALGWLWYDGQICEWLPDQQWACSSLSSTTEDTSMDMSSTYTDTSTPYVDTPSPSPDQTTKDKKSIDCNKSKSKNCGSLKSDKKKKCETQYKDQCG